MNDPDTPWPPAADHPRWGIEFDWLALDIDERVAMLASGGFARVPADVVAAADRVDAAMDLVRQLPLIGEATDVGMLDPGIADWLQAAAQGLYAYDGLGVETAYRRLASPTRWLYLSDLAPAIRSAVELARFTVAFAEAEILTLDQLA
jgi:hypothetical protein